MTIAPTDIGARRPRLEALSKVTGATAYAADFSLPGMLTGRLFRSTVPHARVVRLDTRAARALKGVRAVVTAADRPKALYGPLIQDMPIFASDRVLYVGQPIAAVAAVSPEIAERALAAGVKEVVFDRGGYLFHGRVKALADAAREGGLSF